MAACAVKNAGMGIRRRGGALHLHYGEIVWWYARYHWQWRQHAVIGACLYRASGDLLACLRWRRQQHRASISGDRKRLKSMAYQHRNKRKQ